MNISTSDTLMKKKPTSETDIGGKNTIWVNFILHVFKVYTDVIVMC